MSVNGEIMGHYWVDMLHYISCSSLVDWTRWPWQWALTKHSLVVHEKLFSCQSYVCAESIAYVDSAVSRLKETNWPTHLTAHCCQFMSISTWVVEWRMDCTTVKCMGRWHPLTKFRINREVATVLET